MTSHYEIVSPVDGRVYAKYPYVTAEAFVEALLEARRAQASWAETPIETRARACRDFIDAILAESGPIAEELAWQMGRPIRFGPLEVRRLAERAEHMISIAADALALIELSDEAQERRIERVPLGVALVIAPWNFPYLTAVNTIIPALMAGNAVVLKPAEQTALCGNRFSTAFEKAGLPRGLFRSLLTNHGTIARSIDAGHVDFISFTGSVRGGREIERTAAGCFLPITLELGGKDAAYVKADARLDVTVEDLVDGAFFNSGQSCCGVERIYVHESVCDQFVERFSAETRRSRVLGSPLDLETTLGPVVSRRAAQAIRGQVAHALRKGARIITGENGGWDTDDPYIPATALVDVDHDMEVMREETFGPVVGIMKVTSDEEAVALINDSKYGLTASIWTEDLDAGRALARKVAAGTCFVNRCDYLDPRLAWSGVKDSGRGCSLSSLGYASVTRPRSYYSRSSRPGE